MSIKTKLLPALALSAALILLEPSIAIASEGMHTVAEGDTLSSLARDYQVGVIQLVRANPQLSDANLIKIGETLTIPREPDAPALAAAEDKARKLEKEVVRLVNIERKKKRLKALSDNKGVAKSARAKSIDMRDLRYFSHQSPTYGSPFDQMKKFKVPYRAAGENIATGQQTAKAVVKDWMNSPGHRANILNKNFTRIGVGYAKTSGGQTYWTQQFTRP